MQNNAAVHNNLQRDRLHVPRLISYLLVIATSICVIGTAAWTLHDLRTNRPREVTRRFPGTSFHAKNNKVTSALSIAVASLSLITALIFLLNLLKRRRNEVNGSVATVKRGISKMAQAATLGLLSLATLAIAIASTVIVATKSARVSQPGISGVGRVIGAVIRLAYKRHSPDRAYTICDWLLWLALTIATILTLLARRRKTQRVAATHTNMAVRDPNHANVTVADRRAVV